MVVKSLNLETVCGITSRLPENMRPEVAFAGKSNVGKSSMINALVNRKSYARTSSEPGKTQTINFYNVNNELYLVDLPGYGYAKTSKETREKWGKMIERYLHGSKMLKQVFLLVDARHEPSENDVIMYNWIKSQGYVPVVIATKLDKVKKSAVALQARIIRNTFRMGEDETVILFSAQTKQGRDDIWNAIENCCKA